jgi:hypothetical protein
MRDPLWSLRIHFLASWSFSTHFADLGEASVPFLAHSLGAVCYMYRGNLGVHHFPLFPSILAIFNQFIGLFTPALAFTILRRARRLSVWAQYS